MGEIKINPILNVHQNYNRVNLVNPYRYGGGGGAAYSFLLDEYPGALLAYSFRKLRSDYSGFCLRVRRSSDNLESEIPFTDNYLDETALLNHVGGGNGFISVMYDQSLSAVNWIKTTLADQPQIVSNGTIVRFGSFASLQGRNNKSLSAAFSGFTIANSEYSVINNPTTDNNFILSSGANNNYYCVATSGSGSAANASSGTPSLYVNNILKDSATRGQVFTALTSLGLNLLRLDNLKLDSWVKFDLNYEAATSFQGVSNTLEKIIYPTNADFGAIQNNINDYYSVY